MSAAAGEYVVVVPGSGVTQWLCGNLKFFPHQPKSLKALRIVGPLTLPSQRQAL